MVTTLQIDGMRTVHCARAVFTSLARVPGIRAAEVVVGRATLEHDAPLDAGAVAEAIGDVGFRLRAARTETRVLPLHGVFGVAGDDGAG